VIAAIKTPWLRWRGDSRSWNLGEDRLNINMKVVCELTLRLPVSIIGTTPALSLNVTQEKKDQRYELTFR
jgi:hypothetical protein